MPEPLERGHRLSIAALVLIAIIAPVWSGDDTKFFNYLTNVEHPLLLYFYNGHVPLLAELVSYSLRPLPLMWQAIAYRIAPLMAIVLLYDQLRKLFATRWPIDEAVIPAIAIVLALRPLDTDLYANLSYVVYSAPLVATMYVVRPRHADDPYSYIGIIGVVAAAVSVPFGAFLSPLLAVRALADMNSTRRRQGFLAAGVILAAQIAMRIGSPESLVALVSPAAIASTFAAGFRDNKLWNLIAIASTLGLMGIWWRNRALPWSSPIVGLAIVGIGSALGLPLTARFFEVGGFAPRYVLPVFVCAAAAGAYALADATANIRWLIAGTALGLALALVGVEEYGHLRGPMEIGLVKYRAVAVAERLRRSCRADDIFLFEDDDNSPIVFCRPRPLPVGFFRVSGVPPFVGEIAVESNEPPGIYVPAPLIP